MGLLSIFKRKTDARAGAVPADISPASVQQARARARQRLIGAVVLVVIGVIAFPLLFESQPRPIPVDIPIEIPRREGAPTLVMPPARPAAPSTERAESTGKIVIDEPAREAAGGITPPATVAAGASAPATTVEAARATPPAAPRPQTPEPAAPPKATAAPPRTETPAATAAPAAPSTRPSASADAARAKALLEGKPQASKQVGGFVVQFGAFADAGAAQDTRAKVDALGLKSYTQATETTAGTRIRVRAGPFATREEAERVLIRAKAAGLNAAVLTP